MHKIFFRIFFLASCLLLTLFSRAQDSLSHEKPHMADAMRSNGKIYVVVSVLVIILIGLFIYLINLDRKLSRLEKNTR
jgi:heme export protein D (CcmD)